MTEKVTHLTYEALKSMVEYQDNTTQYCVQILNIVFQDDMKSKNGILYQCICSDGFAKMKMHILNLSPSILANISKLNPIIRILELKLSQPFFIVIKHEVLYLDKCQVGQPLDYEEFKRMNYTNPNGNNEIQFPRAPHVLHINSNKKQSMLPQQQQKQINDFMNQDQQQTKSGVKLSIQQKQSQIKQAPQFVENQIYQPPSDINLLKISELYPGMRGFKIKGRITSKTDITQFKNGKGYLFTIEIIDSDKQTIQGVFFNKLCDKFYDFIDIGKVYYFENASVKTNRYSSKNQNQSDYQIHFEDFSKISIAQDDEEIDTFAYQIKTIEDVDNLSLDEKCDVLGVIIDIKPTTQIMTKSNENRSKKNITLYDQTQRGIDIVLWGQQAEKWQFQKDEIVAFRGLKISDYQMVRNLTVTNSTIYEKNLSNLKKINGFQEFYEFYSKNKDFLETKPKESRKKFPLSYIEQIKKDFEGIRNIKFVKFYEIKAYITNIFTKLLYYEGCENCKRKVVYIQQTKLYHCQSCNQNFDQPSYKYMFNAKIADTTGNLSVSVANDQGQQILQLSCDEFQKKSQVDKDNYVKRANFQQFRFLIIGKVETYNDEIRPRYYISTFIQDDIVSDNEELYNQIKQMLSQNY
ncbi:unnamed protein product (macronuclear) [Paramecium tetraurelia]|uniref:Replication protein A subunit n=1 Tax=Paramecium tetraurelia TaxID=5888 RepID=A0CXL6_PARTE|nr:uncharacterized protein GSPATT00011165001 [Paramecium tetraurelia]CAK75533.1 unnamed protein product [Paramecium tetraurelia]|eukprot:XP_001442930.1 hypothetical protein (macronuclear) [Paramecium tetraurelia strain d4-2]